MSDHTWVQDNLTAYVAGGLAGGENERLERHVAACASCAAELAEIRAADQALAGLFADVRPKPDLEDRMIQALRLERGPRPQAVKLSIYVALGLAAMLVLGTLGALATAMIQDGRLPFPGEEWSLARFTGALAAAGGERDETAPFAAESARAATASEQGSALLWSRVEEEVNGVLPGKDASMLAEELRAKAVGVEMAGGTIRKPTSRTRYSDDPEQSGVGREELKAAAGARGKQPLSAEVDDRRGAWEAKPPGNLAGAASLPQRASVPDSFSRGDAAGKRRMAGLGDIPRSGLEGEGRKLQESLEHLGRSSQDLSFGKGVDGAAKQYYSFRNAVPSSSATFGFHVGQGGEGSGAGGGAGMAGRRLMDESAQLGQKLNEAGSADGTAGIHFKLSELNKTPAAAKPESASRPAGISESKSGVADRERLGGNRLAEKETALAAKGATQPPPATSQPPRKVILRSGDIEFEVESFDAAVAAVTRLVGEIKEGGYVATINSDKLPNGKVKGSMVVRIPAERLDGFVLDLRKELGKMGELKGQKIGSQDVTKEYTDLESRLRAARAMEERLLNIIKTGKGEIKDLIVAEKELGNWRTQIEQIEGQLRYYANLAALSTLTITLVERELKSPFGILETEKVQVGVEVEDVEKAQQETLKAIAELKGRVTKSELKQHAAGQFTCLINADVPPDSAGLLRDRLRQLGTVARLDSERVHQAEGGTGKPVDGKITRKDAQFTISLYNLANIAPRETVNLNLASTDVEGAFRKIIARVEKAQGRVINSNLNQQTSDQTTGTIRFEVKTADAELVLADLKQTGEVMRLQVTENPDVQNVTRAKRGFLVQLFALAQVAPRETSILQVAVQDVPARYRALQEAVARAKGRVLAAQLNEQDKENITAQLDFEVRRTEERGVADALAAMGDVYSRQVTRSQDLENTLDSKVRLQVSLVNAARMPPRESAVLGIEVRDVDQSRAAAATLVAEAKGRTVEASVAKERNGRVTAKLVYDVPLAASDGLIEKLKSLGIVRAQQSTRNTQVPDGPLALARIDATLSNADLIVPSDEGLWPQIRKGLATSFTALSWSLIVVVVGICFVLPWVLVIWGVVKLVARFRRRPA